MLHSTNSSTTDMDHNTLPRPVTMAEDVLEEERRKGWFSSLFSSRDESYPLTTHPSVPTSSAQIESGRRPGKPKLEEQSPGPIKINIGDIAGDLTIYQRFCLPSLAPGLAIDNLPNFDDVTRYAVPKDVQPRIWEREGKRLVDAVTQVEPLRFQGPANHGTDTKDAYAMLADFAGKAIQSLLIVSHDVECLLQEHHQPRSDKDRLERCQKELWAMKERQQGSDKSAGKTTKADEAASIGSDEEFFVFVDYCTAILTRFLCSAVRGASVHINILTHMARISAKVKIVSTNLGRWAQESLSRIRIHDRSADTNEVDRGKEGRAPLVTERGIYRAPSPPRLPPFKVNSDNIPEIRLKVPWALRSDLRLFSALETRTRRETLRTLYYEKCEHYQRNLVDLLEGVLLHLRGTRHEMTDQISPSYEISAMVYETGFEGFQTLVFQDEKPSFSGTSNKHIVNYARNAFHLVSKAVKDLPPPGPPQTQERTVRFEGGSSQRSHQASVGTNISWRYTPNEGHMNPALSTEGLTQHTQPLVQTLELRSMANAITVLFPLLLANPSTLDLVSTFFGRIAFNEHMRSITRSIDEQQQNTFQPIVYREYSAYFSVSTEKFREKERVRRESGGPRSLSNALMRNNNLYEANDRFVRVMTAKERLGRTDINSESFSTDSQRGTRRMKSCREKLDTARDKMKTWVVEEKGVMVTCRKYVALTMFFSIALAVGGVAIGLTLGERVTGVDPFNFTSYCWVLAAFVILIAKSVRVHEWPWNDFLHWRVLCKTLSELSSVTGIDEQLILAKLLQDDAGSILETRGPFNKIFRGNKPGDGFSIDKPIGMWAMLLSGLIMVEVESLDGRRLVCLDLRRGTELGVVESQVRYYHDCLYAKPDHIQDSSRRLGAGEEEQKPTSKVILTLGRVTWMRVLGLYADKEALFY